MAQGKFTPAGTVRVSTLPVHQAWLLETRALAAAEPFFNLPRAQVVAIRDSIERRDPYPVQPYIFGPSSHAVGAAFRAYLLGLLSLRLGDTASARAFLSEILIGGDTLETRVSGTLAAGLGAELSRSTGNSGAAVGLLEELPTWFDFVTNRLLARRAVRERFLMGEFLVAQGRDAEALPWYASFRSYYDLVYMAPAHFRQAEIYERMGNRERALHHYGRFITLWQDCDPEFRPFAREGAAGRGAPQRDELSGRAWRGPLSGPARRTPASRRIA
ncbi:MAG: hypothetical protein HY337_00905 [Gemmatimonadetes bacterium]|nr:hypothetical protein [Gemmatimonadota bacterium]